MESYSKVIYKRLTTVYEPGGSYISFILSKNNIQPHWLFHCCLIWLRYTVTTKWQIRKPQPEGW